MKKLAFFFAFLLGFSAGAFCQDEEILALSGAESLEEIDETTLENLHDLLSHPINLNTAPLSRLLSCGLLTRFQAISIDEYRSSSGDILSLSELSLIEGFNPETARNLAPFISLKSSMKAGGKRERRIRTECQMRLQAKSGSEGYALKVRSSKDDRWSLALTTRSNDLSSNFFPQTWSLSACAGLPSGKGKIIIGDYNARFGQGLSLWSGFTMSGISSPDAAAKHPPGISPAWSLSPEGPVRGVAADLSIGRWTFSGGAIFPGLRSRMEGGSSPIGGLGFLNASLLKRSSELSLTAIAGLSDLRYRSSTPNTKVSASFRWTPGKVEYFAEGAFDIVNKAPGAVAGIIWSPEYGKKAAFLLRHYGSSFDPTLTGGVRIASKCRGESGLSAALAMKHFEINADASRLHLQGEYRAKLTVKTPLQAGPWKIEPRLAAKLSGKTLRHEYRLSASFEATPWEARIRADAVRCRSTALLAYAEGGFKKERLKLYLRAGAFMIDNWDDRIYVYERDAPGVFNVPAYYGRGATGSMVASLKWRRHALFLRGAAVLYQEGKEPKWEVRIQYMLNL